MQTIAILPELTNAPNLHQVCNHNLMASLKLNWKRIFSDRSDCFSNAISSPRALTMHPKYAIVAARANRACEYCDALKLKTKYQGSIVIPSPSTVPTHPTPFPTQTQNHITRHTADR
jgi:hypothetical protein